MPSYEGRTNGVPFGNHNYLRSTRDLKFESGTVAAASVTAETIDGYAQKVLMPGEALAKITSGADSGKLGPFQPATDGANEVQTITINATGGTFKVGVGGEPTVVVAWNATSAVLQTALETTLAVEPGDVVVTGGPGATLAYTLTFGGRYAQMDVPLVTTDPALLIGGAGTAAVALVTAGTPGTNGAADGRGDYANLVGFNDTFLPWQLLHRDVEVGVLYQAAVIQSRCFQRNAAGARIALTDKTANAMQAAKGVRIIFK